MRFYLLKIGRLLFGFATCYSLLVIRDYLSQRDPSCFQDLMEERTSRVDDHCRNKLARANIKTGDNLYLLPSRKLIWCPVFKAASTNWMYNLLPLAGLDQDTINYIRREYDYRHPNLVAREVAPVYSYLDIQELAAQPDSVRFLIVRHPFDRLLSAYRDKLERLGEHPSLLQDKYYLQYGRQIVNTYRPAALERFGSDFFSSEKNFGSPVTVVGRRPELPSWWEFVQWLIASADRKMYFDEHWRPVTDLCHLCLIRYNYILHFENLAYEEQMLVEVLKAENVIIPRRENTNPSNSKDILKTYFSLLDPSDVEKLYDLYESDFSIFNYDKRITR